MEKVCGLCGATEAESELFEGVYDDEIVLICKECARDEHIPVLRKPSPEQIAAPQQERRYSVRERLERLSGYNRRRPTQEQTTVRMNMSRLKMPEPKQMNENVVDNYYWNVNMARRHKKITIEQLSQLVNIPVDVIQSIEKGKIPENYEEIFHKLEQYLGIILLNKHESKVNFTYTQDEERKILEDVKGKMNPKKEEPKKELSKREQLRKLRRGELDLSKQENTEDITLDKLVEAKRKRDKEAQELKFRKQSDDLFGDDVEFV